MFTRPCLVQSYNREASSEDQTHYMMTLVFFKLCSRCPTSSNMVDWIMRKRLESDVDTKQRERETNRQVGMRMYVYTDMNKMVSVYMCMCICARRI